MMTFPEEHKEPDYEKAELDLLRDGLKKTHEERFFTLMRLMKQGIMLKNAKVIHKPLSATDKNKKAMEKREHIVAESQPAYGFINLSEEEKMWQEFNRPFIDKIQSFTRMLRRNKMFDKAVIHPKK